MSDRDKSYEEKTIKSETLYKGKIVDLRIETVELPDKKYAKREIVDHGKGACIIPITDEGKIILIRQYRKAVNEFILEVPAGLVEPGESPEKTADRELQEEIGYKANKLEFLFAGYPSPGFTNEETSFFLARDLVKSELPLDEGEYVERMEFTLDELYSMVKTCVISDMKTIIAILYLESIKNNEI